MNNPHLSLHFQNYFDILCADTPALREQVYRIRYAVYCREFHYEREEDCPGGLEQDEYDPGASHLLIVHKASHVAAGCVRMVYPPLDEPGFLLPMERHCGATLNHAEFHPQRVPRDRLAEISRLAVHPSFRRRPGESESPVGFVANHCNASERRIFSRISMALFAGATAMMALTHRPHMFVMVEHRLARRLQSLGFPFVPVGEPMDYHGLRTAHYMPVPCALHNIWGEQRLLYDLVCELLSQKSPV